VQRRLDEGWRLATTSAGRSACRSVPHRVRFTSRLGTRPGSGLLLSATLTRGGGAPARLLAPRERRGWEAWWFCSKFQRNSGDPRHTNTQRQETEHGHVPLRHGDSGRKRAPVGFRSAAAGVRICATGCLRHLRGQSSKVGTLAIDRNPRLSCGDGQTSTHPTNSDRETLWARRWVWRRQSYRVS
jgi:hypothetical protein